MGVGCSGAVVALSGMFGSLCLGSATTSIALFGGSTGAQTFATGAAVYDISAFLVSLASGVPMELIECE